MSGMNWDEMSKEERLLAEQAVLNFRELNKACNDAADGTVLDVCEDMAMRQGRELTRKTIETSLQLQASDVEKRGAHSDVRMRNDAPPSRSQGSNNHDSGRGYSSLANLF